MNYYYFSVPQCPSTFPVPNWLQWKEDIALWDLAYYFRAIAYCLIYCFLRNWVFQFLIKWFQESLPEERSALRHFSLNDFSCLQVCDQRYWRRFTRKRRHVLLVLVIKATSHLAIFMRGMRAKGKIQSNNYQYGQRRPSFACKTLLVSLIAYMHTRETLSEK